MKKILLAIALLVVTASFVSPALGCALSCAAICRTTCEGTPQEETGCSDGDCLTSLQTCCESAFRNTKGIDDVPCEN
jgi:hypothetical protein